jgi:hypothetical protein
MNDIYAWIKTEESNYETQQVQVGDNWSMNMRDHIQLLFHLMHGYFYKGDNDLTRPFKILMRKMVDLANWTEDIEVKDVVFSIEEEYGRVLSFFVKKYHDEVYVKTHDLDALFDDVTESDNTYGGYLCQNTIDGWRSIPLTRIAFCDQTDVLGSPIAFKTNFSPSAIRKMKSNGWGDTSNGADISIEELIILAQATKQPAGNNGTENKIPGKNIEVYIILGDLPQEYLDESGKDDYSYQLQIRAFYTDPDNNKVGVCLYRKEADPKDLKFFSSSPIDGFGLGFSVAWAELHPQIWTNFLEIHKTKMLESGAKTPIWTDDDALANRQKIEDMENNEIINIGQGNRIGRVETISGANVQLYQASIDRWYEFGQISASAFDPLQGKESPSGTTFRGQERLVAQGKGEHDRKRGKRAKFIESLYREGILQDIRKELNRGTKFLATLSPDELKWVTEQLAECYAHRQQTEDVLNTGLPQTDRETLKQKFIQEFQKRGNKLLLETLRGEFEDVEIRIDINVAGKQKDLVGLSDKILSIFQFVMQNPQGFQMALQIPGMSKAFQDILEYSGLNPADFSAMMMPSNVTNANPLLPGQAQFPMQRPAQQILPQPVA